MINGNVGSGAIHIYDSWGCIGPENQTEIAASATGPAVSATITSVTANPNCKCPALSPVQTEV